MNKRATRFLVGFVVISIAAVAVVAIVGSMLVAPVRRKAPPPPAYLRAETVTVASPSGAGLTSWLIVPPSPRAAVVVLHGVRATRSDMLSRADLLWRNGFIVLVPDLQAHGESSGDHITFGYLEARDAQAAIAYLRHSSPDLRVGAIGVSLGGAALALGAQGLEADAAVLEAVYPTIGEAVDNRVRSRLGPLSRILTPFLLLQLKPRLGVGVEDLRPVDAIKRLKCPVLVVSGTADLHTTEAQTRALYAAANQPKELWLVPGARHVDLLRFDPAGYRTHVVGFLERHLASQGQVLSSPRIGGPLP